jgi:hypothetical protein
VPTKQSQKNFLKVCIVFFVFHLIFSAVYFKRIYQPWGTCDTDFTVFTNAAKDISRKMPIYQEPYLETGIDYYKYSPAFAVFMIPISRLHKHISVPIWYLSMFVFFMSAIFFTRKILTGDNKDRLLSKTFYAFGILMTLRFLLSVIQRVQSDCLTLFLLALFIFALYRRKDAMAGLALASAAMVKLTPLIFLPYLILKKRVKAAFACGGFILLYGLLPALYVGQGKNMEYLKNFFAVHKKNPGEYLFWYKNQSLLSGLARFLTRGGLSDNSQLALENFQPALVWTIFLVLAAVLFFLIFIPRRKTQGKTEGFCYLNEISLVLICMIILSPLAWKHTFVHLIIPHLVLLYYVFYIDRDDKVTRGLLIVSFCINTMLNPEMTGPFSKIIQLYSNVTLGALLLYAALLRTGLKLCKR